MIRFFRRMIIKRQLRIATQRADKYLKDHSSPERYQKLARESQQLTDALTREDVRTVISFFERQLIVCDEQIEILLNGIAQQRDQKMLTILRETYEGIIDSRNGMRKLLADIKEKGL